MKHQRTEGIILRVSDYGESDKLVTFFSPDIGKATGIAKGAKRSKKRFSNKLELFSQLRLMYNQGRRSRLLFLSEADLLNSFLSLRQHYTRYVVAVQLCELVLRFTQEYDSDPQIFLLLHWALNSLDQAKAPLQISALFQLKLLSITGYQPEFEKCYICQVKIQPRKQFTLHSANGALICNNCYNNREKKGGAAPFLSIQTLKFLKKAQGLDLQRIDRLQLPDKAAKEALLFFYRYIRYLLQQDLNSWSLLHALIK